MHALTILLSYHNIFQREHTCKFPWRICRGWGFTRYVRFILVFMLIPFMGLASVRLRMAQIHSVPEYLESHCPHYDLVVKKNQIILLYNLLTGYTSDFWRSVKLDLKVVLDSGNRTNFILLQNKYLGKNQLKYTRNCKQHSIQLFAYTLMHR